MCVNDPSGYGPLLPPHPRLMGRMGFGVGVTDDRDGWPRTKHVLTTSEYGATLQKGQRRGEREKGEKSEPRVTFKVSPLALVCEGICVCVFV